MRVARNYCRGPKWLPGVVAEVRGPLSYVIQMKGGALWRRHINQLQNGTETHLSDNPPSSDADGEHAISDTTEASEPSTTSFEVPATSTTTEMTHPHRYPQRNHSQPDRYIEHY